MAKRFTDTGKWKDVWFQTLPMKYKLFWLYLLDECDNAGVWKPNIGLAQFQIGEPFEESELRRVFGSRITVLDSGYWFIQKFVDFQYGELSPASKPHISVLGLLKKHGVIGYPKGIHTLKEKDKEKEKDKDKEKESPDEFGKTDPNYFLVKASLTRPAQRVNGKLGLIEYFETQGSVVNNHGLADKFMMTRRGKVYNEFSHVWNDYNSWIEKQFV